MNATIQFTCPQCSHTMKLPASTVGKQGKCPSCNAVVMISASQPVQGIQQPPLAPQEPVDPLTGPVTQPAPPAQAPPQPVMPLQAPQPMAPPQQMPPQQMPPQQQPFNPLGGAPPVQQPGTPGPIGGPTPAGQAQPPPGRRAARKKTNVGLMVGGGIGGVVALGLLIWLLISLFSGDSHEKIMEEMFDKTEQMMNVFKTIETVEDARDAKRQIEALKEDMEAIAKRARKLDKPDKATQKRLLAKFMERMKSIERESRNIKNVMRDPRIAAVLQDVLEESFLGPRLDWFE